MTLPASELTKKPATWRGDRRRRLIIMTRIPELGRAKTRLIPALGESGATAIHTALLNHTLTTATDNAERLQADIEVRFAGPEHKRDEVAHLTDGPLWRPQANGDLGARILDALQTAFDEGAQQTVIIGTDCPQLTADRLEQAWQALDQHDVTIGPAEDGGYYLIGLKQPAAELFQNMPWGTETVLKTTLARCKDLRLSVHQLATLSDVDEPEDLIVCRQFETAFANCLPMIQPGLISVVVPTLNEAERLADTLQPILQQSACEVIVADGGSSDGTQETAERLGCRVVHANRGRGRQLNAGAALARGEFLLFLHADTQLPSTFADDLRNVLSTGAIAGAFRLKLTHPAAAYRWVEWGTNLRARRLQLPYGDQGLFLRADDFFRLGGFRCWPLMEDFEMCQRLKKLGRIRLTNSAVSTSARRWEKLGIVRTTAINQWCILRYLCGTSPDKLAAFYRRQKHKQEET